MNLCNDCAHLDKQRRIRVFVCRNPGSERFEVMFARDRTRDACQLYQFKAGRARTSGWPTDLKFIENYRNKYQGSEIWVIGCDPNLDCYPDDFFEGKVNIAIDTSSIAFPDCTYIFLKDTPVIDAIRYTRPHFLKKCLVTLDRPGGGWEGYGLDPIYMRPKMDKRAAQYTRDDWRLMVDQIFGNGSCEFLAYGTSASYAIEAASILGARRIILVGCSGRTMGSRRYACKRGMWAFCPERFDRSDGSFARVGPGLEAEEYSPESKADSTGDLIRQDLELLTELLGAHGVEVVRHRFDGNEFVFEEVR